MKFFIIKLMKVFLYFILFILIAFIGIEGWIYFSINKKAKKENLILVNQPTIITPTSSSLAKPVYADYQLWQPNLIKYYQSEKYGTRKVYNVRGSIETIDVTLNKLTVKTANKQVLKIKITPKVDFLTVAFDKNSQVPIQKKEGDMKSLKINDVILVTWLEKEEKTQFLEEIEPLSVMKKI